MNKKTIGILFTSLLVSGCFFGDVGSGYITKNCSKATNYDDVEVIEERIITSKDNNVITIIFNNTIRTNKINNTFKSIKNSYISELNDLSNLGLKVEKNSEEENMFKVSFEFNQDTISKDLKERYSFEELAHNQINKYEKEGYECK